MAAMQSGSRGTQACIDGCTILSGLIGDLSTYSMFASAGTLESEIENDSFVNYRYPIPLCLKSIHCSYIACLKNNCNNFIISVEIIFCRTRNP